MLVEKKVNVSKEANELAESVFGLVQSIKKHGEDGFQAGMDVPAVIMENMAKLMKGIEGAGKMGEEAKEELAAFINTWTLMGTDIAALFIKKAE